MIFKKANYVDYALSLPGLVEDAKEWAKDCVWGETEEDPENEFIDYIEPRRLLKLIDQHFEGGLEYFIKNYNLYRGAKMSSKNLLTKLADVANHLDKLGFYQEATDTTKLMYKLAVDAGQPNYFTLAGVNPSTYVGSAQDNEALRAAITKKHQELGKLPPGQIYQDFSQAYQAAFGQPAGNPADRVVNLSGSVNPTVNPTLGPPSPPAGPPSPPAPLPSASQALGLPTPTTTTPSSPPPTANESWLAGLPNIGTAKSNIFRKVFAQNLQQQLAQAMNNLNALYGNLKQEHDMFMKNTDKSDHFEGSKHGLQYAQDFQTWATNATNQLSQLMKTLSPSGKRIVLDKAFSTPIGEANEAITRAKTWLNDAPGVNWAQFVGGGENVRAMEDNLKSIQTTLNAAIVTLQKIQ